MNSIAYVVADLKRIGPTNQTLNIIKYSNSINNCIVITLFPETIDTRIDDFISNGIKVISLNLSKKSILLNGIRSLSKVIKEYNINIIHSWGTFSDILSHYVSKKNHVNHIVTLRCYPMEDIPTRMNKFFGSVLAFYLIHIYKKTKYIVACSKTIKNKMEANYHWANFDYIQNGVNTEEFVPKNKMTMRKSLNLPYDKLIFISTGSMIKRKRISETIEAFNKAKIKDAILILAGDGPLLNEYRNKYENENIIFLGKVSNLSEYLCASDIFVSSSESEGMPNAILESLSCNVPVLLSDIPQHIEVLDEVIGCGKIYKLGNSDELANIMKDLSMTDIDDMKTRCSLIRNSSFTMKEMGRKYESYYQTIIK